jgi:hypothetical protein
MTYDQEKVRALYKKLLALYPCAFREQVGESMTQTFNDLYNERKQQTKPGLLGYVLWIFIETSIGIVREHISLIKEMNPMKNILASFRSPALISFILVLPFMILEFIFNTVNQQNAPGLTALFGLMWLLPMVFIVILMPIVRNVRARNSVMMNPITLLLRVACLVFIAMMWGGILIDQWPCFMGVANCD